MAELKIYECDRCGKEFKLCATDEPESIIIYAFEEEKKYELCDECVSTVSIMMREHKAFNELADKLYREKYQ